MRTPQKQAVLYYQTVNFKPIFQHPFKAVAPTLSLQIFHLYVTNHLFFPENGKDRNSEKRPNPCQHYILPIWHQK